MDVFGNLQRIILYFLVTLESQTDELIVLSQNLSGRTREVQADLSNVGTQIVDAEWHFFGQVFFAFPANPAKSRIYQTELMTRYTDRKYPFQTEIPLRVRIEERKNETTTGGIYVDRNVITGFGVVSVESFVQCFNVIVQSCPCNTLDRYNTDRVFITHLQRFFGVESGLFKSQRHFAHFDLPQLRELFPYNLETCWDNEVRFVKRFTLSLSFLTPAQPCSYTAQHTSFGRTDCQRTGFPCIFFRRVPQVGDDVDTFAIHYGDTRIFGFINIVDVDCLVHQLGSVIVHISGYESS